MIPEILGCFEQTIALLEDSVADLSDQEMVMQPAGLPNHAAWTLGHVAYSCQAIAGELGVAGWLPPGWSARFGTGSTPCGRVDDYPSQESLVATLDDAVDRVKRAVRAAGEPGLAAPLPDARYRDVLPTVGHAVVQVLGAHMAWHAGQLSTWRRALGRPPVGGSL